MQYLLTLRYSDDPWNQTAADNAEWLQRFKRDVGITKDPGPGLPPGYSWALEQGGTGFAPPYAFPKGKVEPFREDVQVNMRDGAKSFVAGHETANHYLETLLSEDKRPPNVFCSRELESGLAGFVEKSIKDNRRFPSDAEMQAYAKGIIQTPQTAADDPVLLGKFKSWMKEKLPDDVMTGTVVEVPSLPSNMDINITDAELGNILEDMDFDFEIDGLGTGLPEQTEESGGVRLGEPSVYE